MTTTQFTLLFFAAVAVPILLFLRQRYRHEFIVQEGFAGLLYHEGKFERVLNAGRCVRFGRNFRLVQMDVRKTILQIPGQEILTADNVTVKVSLVLTLQVTDPALAAHAADNATAHVYSSAQTILRSLAASINVERLLTERATIGPQVCDQLAASAQAVGLHAHLVEIRDVMLPGELRKAFSEVLRVRQDGQAALERARSESATLRSLANAARLVESHPALVALRFLRTLESSGASQTIIMNDLTKLSPALFAQPTKSSDNTNG